MSIYYWEGCASKLTETSVSACSGLTIDSECSYNFESSADFVSSYYSLAAFRTYEVYCPLTAVNMHQTFHDTLQHLHSDDNLFVSVLILSL